MQSAKKSVGTSTTHSLCGVALNWRIERQRGLILPIGTVMHGEPPIQQAAAKQILAVRLLAVFLFPVVHCFHRYHPFAV